MIHQLFNAFNWMGSEWVLVILIGLSVLTVAVILQRWSAIGGLYRASNRFWHEVGNTWYATADTEGWRQQFSEIKMQYPSLETEALTLVLQTTERPSAEAQKVVLAYVDQRRMQLEGNVGFLGTVGANAPFIGLFGTVLGIIRAFHELSSSGISAGMENISSGLSEALVATAVGLMVAIPAVIAFNVINKRIQLLVRRTHGLTTFVTAKQSPRKGE